MRMVKDWDESVPWLALRKKHAMLKLLAACRVRGRTKYAVWCTGPGQSLGLGKRQGSELPLERMSTRRRQSTTQAQQLLGMGTSRLSNVVGDV